MSAAVCPLTQPPVILWSLQVYLTHLCLISVASAPMPSCKTRRALPPYCFLTLPGVVAQCAAEAMLVPDAPLSISEHLVSALYWLCHAQLCPD